MKRLKSDYFRIEMKIEGKILSGTVSLKSDYFRIEMAVIFYVDKIFIGLKSDYFRIEMNILTTYTTVPFTSSNQTILGLKCELS